MKFFSKKIAIPICALFLWNAHGDDFQVNEDSIISSKKNSQEWLSHGRTYDEQRFSELKQISNENIDRLGIEWFADLDSNRGHEATPIVSDGVMFTTGAWSVVYAHNALSGELLWKFDPEVPKEKAYFICCDVVNRGVAIWEGKVFVGTLDGRLVALDANKGTLIWETMTVDDTKPYSITGAPRVIKGKVIIGNGGADFGVRGYVSAYDALDGKMEWRFYTVPGKQWKWLQKLGKAPNGGNMVVVEPFGTQWHMIQNWIFSTLEQAMLHHGIIKSEARVVETICSYPRLLRLSQTLVNMCGIIKQLLETIGITPQPST